MAVFFLNLCNIRYLLQFLQLFCIQFQSIICILKNQSSPKPGYPQFYSWLKNNFVLLVALLTLRPEIWVTILFLTLFLWWRRHAKINSWFQIRSSYNGNNEYNKLRVNAQTLSEKLHLQAPQSIFLLKYCSTTYTI